VRVPPPQGERPAEAAARAMAVRLRVAAIEARSHRAEQFTALDGDEEGDEGHVVQVEHFHIGEGEEDPLVLEADLAFTAYIERQVDVPVPLLQEPVVPQFVKRQGFVEEVVVRVQKELVADVPQVQVVEAPGEYLQIVPKQIEKLAWLVPQLVERQVGVAAWTAKEEFVENEAQQLVEINRQAMVPVVQEGQKVVPVPLHWFVEATHVEVQELGDVVPQLEVREVVPQVQLQEFVEEVAVRLQKEVVVKAPQVGVAALIAKEELGENEIQQIVDIERQGMVPVVQEGQKVVPVPQNQVTQVIVGMQVVDATRVEVQEQGGVVPQVEGREVVPQAQLQEFVEEVAVMVQKEVVVVPQVQVVEFFRRIRQAPL
jgi:hypothetical protein